MNTKNGSGESPRLSSGVKPSNKNMFKVVIVGDSFVGKTHILHQYVQGQIPTQKQPTIGVDFMIKQVQIPISGETIRISFFDTAGEEKYHAVTACHYRKALGAIIVYDVTTRSSFDNVEKWLKDVKQLADPDCVVLLLGNKADVDQGTLEEGVKRQVSTDEGILIARRNNLEFSEVSAIQNHNIEKSMLRLATRIYERHRQQFAVTGSGKYQEINSVRLKKPSRFECCVWSGRHEEVEGEEKGRCC